MSARSLILAGVYGAVLLMLGGCETVKPYDYTNLRAHPPRSILILPPLNESTKIEATYGYFSTVTAPVAELGYYVYPVDIVDRFFQENGMPTAGEMHQVPLDKVVEITGADAVMFITVEDYGTNYKVIDSQTVVKVHAKLVDTRTQLLLWEGRGAAVQSATGGSNNIFAKLIAAAVSQMISSTGDKAHGVSRAANVNLFMAKSVGLPYGPYSPKYNKDY